MMTLMTCLMILIPTGVLVCSIAEHGSSKATKNESSRPDKIPPQMLPMGIWGPENMKIENI